MFYLENLRSQEIKTGILPWEFKPVTPIPEEVRADKKARDSWINAKNTRHHVYTFNAGVNTNLRISRARSDGEGNPVRVTHALVADFDSKQNQETVLKLANEFSYPPNWIEKTLSGNWRFIWLLACALIWPSQEFYQHFFKIFPSFGFDPSLAMIGLDRGAWEASERLYTNSCEWFFVHDKPIAADQVRGWLMKASESFSWTDKSLGIQIPLDVIKPALEKKYPRFAEWPGDFELNAQGPTFWVSGSESPKSAIVRETGLQTFSEHATKGFYTWNDLLGVVFCQKYEAEAIGRAVEGVYHDGKHYYRRQPDGSWKNWEKGDILGHFKTGRGISQKNDKAGVSDLDRCIEYVQSYQSIYGAAPFCFRPPGLITVNGRNFLNTSTLRVLQPADGPGEMPFLSNFFENFFSSPEQLDYFLSWLSYYYRSCYTLKPRSGQNLFIAGPAGIGKTLLNRAIIAGLVGGYEECQDYLTGKDGFGSELFEVAHWVVDDSSATADSRTHKIFSEMLKKMSANKTFRYHAKFRIALKVDWQGRVVVTLNADEESIRNLPDLEISIRDKLMLFKASERDIKFPDQDELDRILARELPIFARFLLEYQIPEHCRGDSRFGVKSYLEPSLVETAQQSSRTAGFAEILQDWRHDFFVSQKSLAPFWEGTAYQLHKQILSDPTSEPAMRNYSVDAVGRHLAALKNKGNATDLKIESEAKGSTRVWRIYRLTEQTTTTTT